MSAVTGCDVSNPAVFGWQWAEGETVHQLYLIRGSRLLHFALRVASSHEWSRTTVAAPERFVTEPVRTRAQWHAVITRWFESTGAPMQQPREESA